MPAYPPCLLDTDILSELLKGHPKVREHAAKYLSEHGRLTFSQITQYEILKGLQSKKASKQIEAFMAFCQANIILPLTDAGISKAAQIYAELRGAGHLISDADILVAAIALTHRLTLVTNNYKQHGSLQTYPRAQYKKLENLTVTTPTQHANNVCRATALVQGKQPPSAGRLQQRSEQVLVK